MRQFRVYFLNVIELSYKQQKKQYWEIFEYWGIN